MYEEMVRRAGVAEAAGYEGQRLMGRHRWQPSNLESCSDRGRPSLDPMTATIASTTRIRHDRHSSPSEVKSKNKAVHLSTPPSLEFATQLYHSLIVHSEVVASL